MLQYFAMTKEKRLTKTYFSPARLFVAVAATIFITEAIIMAFFYVTPMPALAETVLDPVILTLLLSPVLYFFLFKPILMHIMERRRVEEDLTRERDRAQRFLDTAEVIMVVLDPAGRVSLINKKGCGILGREEGEITGKNWFENFVPANSWWVAQAAFYASPAAPHGASGSFENPVLTGKGETRDILWHYTPITENGVSAGILLAGSDITGRKEMEKALIDSEAHYRLVHNSSFDGIIVSNAEDKVIDCNPSAEKIFGYDRGSLVGSQLSSLMPEEYRKRHNEGLKRFLATGKSHIQGKVLELEGLRKNEERFPIELVLSSFSVESEVKFTGTIRDVTEKKKAEKDKALMQAHLNQAQKIEAVGRLAGGIAHDFNNILTSVRGNAELVLEDTERTNQSWTRLNEIIQAAVHASKLTRQLLLFSRGQPVETAPLNVNAIIENILVMLKRLIGGDITVTTELAPEIATVWADEGNIEQVILNLTVNARDAMPEGGALLIKTENIALDETSCKDLPECSPGKYVRITVRDTGEGMDKETQKKIFEPFFSTKGTEHGTGLGLSVVYGIAKRHGGCVTVESEPGKGAAFHIYLPVLGRPAEEQAAEAGGALPAVSGAKNV